MQTVSHFCYTQLALTILAGSAAACVLDEIPTNRLTGRCCSENTQCFSGICETGQCAPHPPTKESWTKKTVMGMSVVTVVIIVTCILAIGLFFLGYYIYLEVRHRRKQRLRAEPGVVFVSDDSSLVELALG